MSSGAQHVQIDTTAKFSGALCAPVRHNFSDDGAASAYIEETQLLRAIRQGELSSVQALYPEMIEKAGKKIKATIHISDRWEITLTPLAYAVLCDQPEIAEYFIQLTDIHQVSLQGIAYTIKENFQSANNEASQSSSILKKDEGSILYAAITCLHNGTPNKCVHQLIAAGATLFSDKEKQLVMESIFQITTPYMLADLLMKQLVSKDVLTVQQVEINFTLRSHAVPRVTEIFQQHQPLYGHVQAIARLINPVKKKEEKKLIFAPYELTAQHASPPTTSSSSTASISSSLSSPSASSTAPPLRTSTPVRKRPGDPPSPTACAASIPSISPPPPTPTTAHSTACNTCFSFFNPVSTVIAAAKIICELGNGDYLGDPFDLQDIIELSESQTSTSRSNGDRNQYRQLS